MQFHKQRLLHRPEEGQQGDCYRTMLACLLDMDPEGVPHFMADPAKPITQVWVEVDQWLHEAHGLRYIAFPFDASDINQWLRNMGGSWPGLRWELAGVSPRGTMHSVIVENGKIIHDVHPEGGGVVAPSEEDGHYWMGFLLPTAVHGTRPEMCIERDGR